ncbi:pilus assembly protein TadG-related protein [Rhizobium sp. ZW T2_16]|uniref:vWA domain-containing protein n=1 Tax=Rhizobium sp. ZW T2_16 TaxID=3378083 RepID=UPI003854711D
MTIFKRFADDRGGNFGMMTALMLPLLCGAAGFAIDFTNAMQVKTNLQSIADAASLAGASAMSQQGYTKAQAEKLTKDYFVAQIIASGLADATTTDEKTAAETKLRAATTATATENTSGSAKPTYTVKLDTLYALNLNPITGIFAGKSMSIGINATSTTGTDGNDTRTGISMYLALDRSGSMSFVTSTSKGKGTSCVNYTAENWRYKDYLSPSSPCYVRKIEALKTAANALFDSLKKADSSISSANSTSTLVRVGAVSYTDETQKASSIAWGTAAASTYVQNLPNVPTGGTDANGAMQLALDALKKANSTEADAHKSKKNDTFNRYIVLMTDGEMTGGSSDWNPDLDKAVRTKCSDAKKDGIMIFTVAFMAPDNGKSLLSACATSSDYYYSPDDMNSLVAAFGDIADKAAKQTVRLTN